MRCLFPYAWASHRTQTVANLAGRIVEVLGVEPRFLLLSDVAAELNVTDSQVYHMVRSGELPAIKIGGRGQWRVERAKLEQYIEQRYAETADWVAQNPLSTPEPE